MLGAVGEATLSTTVPLAVNVVGNPQVAVSVVEMMTVTVVACKAALAVGCTVALEAIPASAAPPAATVEVVARAEVTRSTVCMVACLAVLT